MKLIFTELEAKQIGYKALEMAVTDYNLRHYSNANDDGFSFALTVGGKQIEIIKDA